jgi:hypothetical protein
VKNLSPSAWSLFLLALAIHLAAGAVGWNNRILQNDVSDFRQPQTAFSAYWMLGHRYQIAYETPVFGPPWSMPFEFPFYQWVVAGLTTLTGWPLDQTGRVVAEGFFLMCLGPSWSLLGRLGVTPQRRVPALALLLVSPLYLFWSRAFLIETTALFLMLAYLAAAWAYLDRPRVGMFLLAVVFGILAALVKITTCSAAWLCLSLLLARSVRRHERWRQVLAGAALVGISLGAGVLWTRFADGLKEQNPFARHLTSRALWEWNFGSWELRWQWLTWGNIFLHNYVLARQNALLLFSLLLAPLAGRRCLPAAGCGLVYLTLPLVFTNLYRIHEYYACASMIFQVGAVALVVVGLSERDGWRRWLGSALAAVFLTTAAYDYLVVYYPIQAVNRVESAAVCQAVQEHTDSDDVILVLGCDWGSDIPYHSRRRALMVPVWSSTPLADLPRYLERLHGYRLRGLVIERDVIQGEQFEGVLRDLRAIGLSHKRSFSDATYAFYSLRPADQAAHFLSAPVWSAQDSLSSGSAD